MRWFADGSTILHPDNVHGGVIVLIHDAEREIGVGWLEGELCDFRIASSIANCEFCDSCCRLSGVWFRSAWYMQVICQFVPVLRTVLLRYVGIKGSLYTRYSMPS